MNKKYYEPSAAQIKDLEQREVELWIYEEWRIALKKGEVKNEQNTQN